MLAALRRSAAESFSRPLCLGLGHTEIPAKVMEMDELHCTIAESDENLCGTQLSAAERAEFTDRPKLAFEHLHPETKRDGDRRSDQVAKFATRSFAEETAASTGKATRTVRLDATRGANISSSAFDAVKGTKLDTGAHRDELKAMPESEQTQRVETDLKALEDKRRVSAAAAKVTEGRGRKGTKQGPLHGPSNSDRPARFAWLVEELAGLKRADFEALQTLDLQASQQSIKRALS